MSARLKQIVSWWFILQIVVPFTAPLQTLDVLDLFGAKSHHSAPASPESTTTPTLTEASTGTSVVSLITPTPLTASVIATIARDPDASRTIAAAFRLSPTPQVQRSVLRL